MAERPSVRKRSSLLADLVIIFLGIWGFIRQCVRSLSGKGRSHELESGD